MTTHEDYALQEQQVIDALKEAVAEALERKRRLGQYAVVWRDNQPVLISKPPGDSREQ